MTDCRIDGRLWIAKHPLRQIIATRVARTAIGEADLRNKPSGLSLARAPATIAVFLAQLQASLVNTPVHEGKPRGSRLTHAGIIACRESYARNLGARVTFPSERHLPTLAEIPYEGEYPRQPAEFTHELQNDPRLTLAAVADLADRLPRTSVIYDTSAQPLLVPQGGPPRGALSRPGDVIRNLDEAKAWLTLLNIEEDPDYADLMNATLDKLEPGMVAIQGKMRNRVGFVFVSSPNSVTPAHFDIEHSLLMQVSGSKLVSFGHFAREEDRRHEVNRYWDGSHGRIENLPPELASYQLTPGRGVYIPPVAPHWVHNGPAISLSVTLTYFTAATEKENMIEALNAKLRRLHMAPRPPGQAASVDMLKVATMRASALASRVRAKPQRSQSHSY